MLNELNNYKRMDMPEGEHDVKDLVRKKSNGKTNSHSTSISAGNFRLKRNIIVGTIVLVGLFFISILVIDAIGAFIGT